jgi:hypothetical protein
MRPLAGLAIALGCCSGTQAVAQIAPTAPDSGSSLLRAAFVADASRTATGSSPTNSSFAPGYSKDAIGARPAYDPLSALTAEEAYRPGEGPVAWTVNQVSVGKPGKASVDTLRLSVGGALRTPGGLPLNMERAQFDAHAYEVAVIRDWPEAVRFETGAYDVALTPHAGVGVGSDGGSAEAGAMLTLGQKRDNKVAARLKAMGVQDGAQFGNEGRWYIYAAASGRAVGLNMRRDGDGWDRAGWSTDATSTLISDAQLGVGWRKGDVQTSFGLLHREVKGDHLLMGQTTKEDSLVAFTLSIKPRR